MQLFSEINILDNGLVYLVEQIKNDFRVRFYEFEINQTCDILYLIEKKNSQTKFFSLLVYPLLAIGYMELCFTQLFHLDT